MAFNPSRMSMAAWMRAAGFMAGVYRASAPARNVANTARNRRIGLMAATESGQARIVIIGAGFAGIEVARGLSAAGLPVTLIDRQNYHLFQPLLYQVATAALSPADIAEPVRRMLRTCPNLQVVLGEVTGIHHQDQRLALDDGSEIAYDILVIAAGATHAYFGHDAWEKFAPGLKTIPDAR